MRRRRNSLRSAIRGVEDDPCRGQPGPRPGGTVTEDKTALEERLQAVTGGRIAALKSVGEEKAPVKSAETAREPGSSTGRAACPEKTPQPKSIDRELGL